jgi:hypothetical protein
LVAVTVLKPNEYQCAMCRGVFEYGWSDERATTELANNFPGFEKDDCAVICDDCYQGTGLFCGPPEDPYKDVPKHIREVYRAAMNVAAKEIYEAWENHILYGAPLTLRLEQ